MTAEEIIANGDYLEHFNPFHNPKNGQFAKKSGGVSSDSKSSIHKKALAVGVAGAAVAGMLVVTKTGTIVPLSGYDLSDWSKEDIDRYIKAIANFRKTKAIAIGKRSIEGFLAAYGGVRLGSEIVNRKKGGE